MKDDFNPKAVSKLMGHAKEIVTIDVYGDNKGIISDCVPELQSYIEEVLPTEKNKKSIGIRAVGHSSRCRRFYGMKQNICSI